MRFEPPNDSNRWDSPLFKVFNGSSEVNGGGKGIDSARTAVQSPSTQARNESLKDDSNTVKNVPAAATETVTSKSSWRPVKKATKKKTIPDSTLDTASVFYGTNEQAVNSASNTSATVGSQSIAPQSEALSFSGTTAAACDVDLADTQIDRNVVFTEIWNYFEGASVPVPNSSTIAVQRGAADILHELDRISQQVVLSLLAHQQSDSSSIVEGTPLKFPEFDRALALHRPVGLAELQRFRRQYVKINSQHPPANAKAVGASFIDFLSTQL